MPLTNTQYESIMREYEEKQSISRHELESRKSEIRKKIPEYFEIISKETSLYVQKSELMLSDMTTEVMSVSEELELLHAQKKKLLRNSGYPEDYLVMHYFCKDCKDTGFINGEKCHCFKQKAVSLLYEQSGIEELLSTENFDSLSYEYYMGEDLEHFKNAVQTCKTFVRNFNSDYRNLFLYGNAGVGKSFLSCCVAKELIEKGNLIIYFSAVRLFAELSKATFMRKNGDDTSYLRDDLYESDLLIIDDLGTELTNAFTSTEFFSLLNERHLRKKSTVISTNLSMEDFRERYSDRIFSRIASYYELLRLSGPDIRVTKKRQLSRK